MKAKKILKYPRDVRFMKQLPPLGLRGQKKWLGVLKFRSLKEKPHGAKTQISGGERGDSA